MMNAIIPAKMVLDSIPPLSHPRHNHRVREGNHAGVQFVNEGMNVMYLVFLVGSKLVRKSLVTYWAVDSHFRAILLYYTSI
jgi:hypothetical protein